MRTTLLLFVALAGTAQARPYDARLTDLAYPFPVQMLTIETQQQSLEMAYMDLQPKKKKANGHTVVLLHGKNFSGAYWERTAQALLDEGYRVVIPDQIGFGKSSKPEHYQFTIAGLANNTHTLLGHLGVDEAVVVGHSLGGMIASRYALQFPSETEGLALVNPIGLEDWSDVVPYVDVDVQYQAELKKTPESVQAYMTNSYFDNNWRPEYQPLVDLQANWTQDPDYPLVAWNAALTYDMLYTQPVIHDLDELQMPTLLLLGERDRSAPGRPRAPKDKQAELGRYDLLGPKVAAQIPDATLVMLPGIGHLPQFESYDAYWAALSEFVDKVTE